MLKLLKNNLKQSWLIIIIIVMLLGVQAMADLNLPDFTSKIVNIGIQQKGVENASPDIVTKDTMDKILLLTKQDDFIMENYQLLSKDNLSEKEYDKYIKKYPNAENKEVYVIKNIDQETRDKLDLEIAKSFMLVTMLEKPETAEQLKTQLINGFTIMKIQDENNIQNQLQNIDIGVIVQQDIFTTIKMIPQEMLD